MQPASAFAALPPLPHQAEEILADWYQRQVPRNCAQREDPIESEREAVLAGLHPTVQRRMLNAAREINSGTPA